MRKLHRESGCTCHCAAKDGLPDEADLIEAVEGESRQVIHGSEVEGHCGIHSTRPEKETIWTEIKEKASRSEGFSAGDIVGQDKGGRRDGVHAAAKTGKTQH